MKRYIVFVFFISLFLTDAMAQSSFAPKNLGAGVNSVYDELNPVVSGDGKQLFFVRANHPANSFGGNDSQDIWASMLIGDSTWTEPTRVPGLNIGRYNAVLSVSEDGKEVLLNGVFNKKGNIWKKRGLSIARSNGSGGWSAPERLKVPAFTKKNRGMRSSASMSADGKSIVLSYSKIFNGEKNNLYLSEKKKNGGWSRPSKIKSVSLGRSDEQTPFITGDGTKLFFASDRRVKGQYDIYVSTKSTDGKGSWSAPVMLGDTINSTGFESYFKTNAKGSWAYFSSSNSSLGKADIYRVKLFEENPFVIVTGTVLNQRDGRPLTGKQIALFIDGQESDSIKINPDSATFTLKLPLGKKYEFRPYVKNYTGATTTLDVTIKKEFSKSNIELLVTPVPYVLVRGNVMEQSNRTVPDPIYNVKITVNGSVVDSLNFDRNTGAFEVRLKHGVAYEFAASAQKHESVPAKLDLTTIGEYEEIKLDLYVLREKMAVVEGKVIDKKTGKILEHLSKAQITVEGFSDILASIDTVTGSYQLRLPLGRAFTFSAAMNNYYPLYETIDLTNEITDVKIYKDIVIVPIEVGQSIRLNNIFFDAGKSILKAESFPELDRVVDFLSKNTSIRIEISGHTDNVGKASSNLKLSQGRAQSVADYVVKKGIDKTRVVAKGYGDQKPVASNVSKEGKAQNRRVEFTVLDNN
ncbi:MAG TPA: OmpA family protein [Chryseosolibacter sp.]|nr:OmpA family protein [Chryseosolibacter sp.]